jgi:hypothetical protein
LGRVLFALIEKTSALTWLLLSKRIGNALKMTAGGPPENSALGATMINLEEWDRDLPKLKWAGAVLGARFTFASVEPMLGPIETHAQLPDWVIVGGESGRTLERLASVLGRTVTTGDQEAAEALRDLVETVTVSRRDGAPGTMEVLVKGSLNALLGAPETSFNVPGVGGSLVAAG